MKYVIIAPNTTKDGELKALPLKKAKEILKKGNHSFVAETKDKTSAEGFIMGLKAHLIVEKYASQLPTDVKIDFKTEIAQMAVGMHNAIIK